MQLDRNLNPSGKGKYALINLRKIPSDPRTPDALADAIKENPECVEFGAIGASDEFWLIKLKDKYAFAALSAYADTAETDDHEYAAQIREMLNRAGTNNPYCKNPD